MSRSAKLRFSFARERGMLGEMLVLYQPPGAWGLSSVSPFCIKLELWLRMAGLPYTVEFTGPQHSPKRNVPYLRDGALLLSDSQFIIEHLQTRYRVTLDAHLPQETLVKTLPLRRLAEEHLYFLIAHFRWSGELSWPHVSAVFQGFLPPVVAPVLVRVLRKQMLRTTYAQGVGRHTHGERLELLQQDLQALEGALGTQSYFLGEQPSSLDATMFAMLASLLWVPWNSDETRYARSRTTLVNYCQRIRERYWP